MRKHGALITANFPQQQPANNPTIGIISTMAGEGGLTGYSGDGLAATKALLFHPTRIAVSSVGEVYIADCYNHAIRKVSSPPTDRTV